MNFLSLYNTVLRFNVCNAEQVCSLNLGKTFCGSAEDALADRLQK